LALGPGAQNPIIAAKNQMNETTQNPMNEKANHPMNDTANPQ
jgi:hypothetical protein